MWQYWFQAWTPSVHPHPINVQWSDKNAVKILVINSINFIFITQKKKKYTCNNNMFHFIIIRVFVSTWLAFRLIKKSCCTRCSNNFLKYDICQPISVWPKIVIIILRLFYDTTLLCVPRFPSPSLWLKFSVAKNKSNAHKLMVTSNQHLLVDCTDAFAWLWPCQHHLVCLQW